MSDAAGKRYDVLVVGAGQGGAQAAASLRAGGFTGSIGLIGEQHDAPYGLPPLSKDYLAGEKGFECLRLRPETFWAQKDVDLNLGRRVVSVDAQAHTVTDTDGAAFGYGALIWATGARLRRLSCPGADLQGVHAIRRRDDVDRLRGDLANAQKVVVIGAGYIGLEAAAVLRKAGKAVWVVEAQERVLSRVAGARLSQAFEAAHRLQGVDIRLGSGVERLIGVDGRVSGVVLADGSVLAADVVIVGIGVIPEVEPLIAAGAEGGDGVDVDAQCRTSLPDIFAIGDCAAHLNAFAGGRRIRLESVQNANDQAVVAAKTLLGETTAYDATPWFWSQQFDLKLQTVGLLTGYDEEIVRGDVAKGSFSVIYRREGRVIALDCVNATKDFVQGKALVRQRAVAPVFSLMDSSIPLSTMVLAEPA